MSDISFQTMQDAELFVARARLHAEMKRRNLPLTVGGVAEKLAIEFFNETPGCPNLQAAPPGTSYVDALSRKGERYSIKGILDGRKTGTVYPDPDDADKVLFEFLLVVIMDADWAVEVIYEFDWKGFLACRKWDSRMKAWYVGAAAKTFACAKAYRPSLRPALLRTARAKSATAV